MPGPILAVLLLLVLHACLEYSSSISMPKRKSHPANSNLVWNQNKTDDTTTKQPSNQFVPGESPNVTKYRRRTRVAQNVSTQEAFELLDAVTENLNDKKKFEFGNLLKDWLMLLFVAKSRNFTENIWIWVYYKHVGRSYRSV